MHEDIYKICILVSDEHTLNISFRACAKVELWDLIVCIAVKGEKFQSHAMTFTFVRQCPILDLSEIFSYTTLYSNFMFIDQLHFELSCKNMETQKHAQTLTSTLKLRFYKTQYKTQL